MTIWRMGTLGAVLGVMLSVGGATRLAADGVPTSTVSSPVVVDVELQPLVAQVTRLTEALDYLGAPLPAADKRALENAKALRNPAAAVRRIQEILDRHVLLDIDINPESRVHVAPGGARPELVEQGWRTVLVKVRNAAGVTAPLRVSSPHAQAVFSRGPRGFSIDPRPTQTIAERDVRDRWLDLAAYEKPPLTPTLSGLEVEYRILQLYAREAGRREASLAVDVGQGTQDIGFRNDTPILFTVRPSAEVTLRVADERREPTTAVVRDRGRAGPRLSVAGETPRARLRLPSAGLPDRRRAHSPARGPVRSRGHARARVRADASDDHRRPRSDDRRPSRWSAGSTRRRAVGTRAIITSMPPAALHYETPTEGVEPRRHDPAHRRRGS